MLGIVIILFGLFTFIIPFILGLPSNYDQNMPFPIMGASGVSRLGLQFMINFINFTAGITAL